MSAPKNLHSRPQPPRGAKPVAAVEAKPLAAVASNETGWLPDYVYTGEKFEAGLAFFADALGRITRFSREPADLAAARRLAGQAVLPGLVNVHAVSWQRVLRGRPEPGPRSEGDALSAWRAATEAGAGRLGADEVYGAAKMAFMEMLLAGVTCVGEFHDFLRQPNGAPWPEPGAGEQIVRAAHEVGIRLGLFAVASLRGGFGQSAGSAPARASAGSIDAFVREAEALRVRIAQQYPADEAWLGVAAESLAAVPLDALKAIATYAHSQRLRVQLRLALRADEAAACQAEHGRAPVPLLAEHGVIDKRFTALHGLHLSDDDCRVLGSARAAVAACPLWEHSLGLASAPADTLLAAGAAVALGSAAGPQLDLWKEARELEYSLRCARQKRVVVGPDSARTLCHAATVAGARSLGATGGALEVGRPADFFTVNLYDPSIAGADAESLLNNIVFSLERRAVREVWIGARQRIANARHPDQGAIVGRFTEMQRRIWTGAA